MTLPSLYKPVDERSHHEENELPDEKVSVGHRINLKRPAEQGT